MAGTPLEQEKAERAAEAYRADVFKALRSTARRLGLPYATYLRHTKIAALRGLLLDSPPAMPGFRISQVTEGPNGQSVQQKPELAPPRPLPDGQLIKGVSRLENGSGEILLQWVKTDRDRETQAALMREMVAAMATELPRAEPVVFNGAVPLDPDKVNQYTVTDYHFGMMAWGEETGGADWDLKIAETLWCKWWTYAVRNSAPAETAIFAQLGDLVHFDGLKAITPAHGHVLDSDSRFAKIVRTVIRCCRFAVRELLTKHKHVHLIFSDANHDEASEVWMRELFAAHFEDDPRVTVDRSPGTYNAFEWGLTSLFYHHGHKKRSGKAGSANAIDSTWAARFRELFGRTKFSYGHTGHLHSDDMFTGGTGIKVERHETLAAPSTYEAAGGYESGRSAKVITYSKRYGECGRITVTPEMVADAA